MLRDLAASTGDRDFVIGDATQLRTALASINRELRSSFLLFYRAPDEEAVRVFRRVSVIPTHSDVLRVRSRTGYFTAAP